MPRPVNRNINDLEKDKFVLDRQGAVAANVYDVASEAELQAIKAKVSTEAKQDLIKTVLDGIRSVLDTIYARLTNKTQFTRLTDGTNDVAVYADSSLRTRQVGFSSAVHSDVLVGNVDVMLLAANSERKYAAVINNTGTPIYIALGRTATAGKGITIPAKSFFEFTTHKLWLGEIRVVAGGNNLTIEVIEGT